MRAAIISSCYFEYLVYFFGPPGNYTPLWYVYYDGGSFTLSDYYAGGGGGGYNGTHPCVRLKFFRYGENVTEWVPWAAGYPIHTPEVRPVVACNASGECINDYNLDDYKHYVVCEISE